jgi:hypothetical protein
VAAAGAGAAAGDAGDWLPERLRDRRIGKVSPRRAPERELFDEIATKVTPGAHAVLILDQDGWHGAKELKVPSNISLLPLPPRAPELNSQENIWQFMRH